MSLNKVGDVKRLAGDRAGALAAYEESLSIARNVAAATVRANSLRSLSVDAFTSNANSAGTWRGPAVSRSARTLSMRTARSVSAAAANRTPAA